MEVGAQVERVFGGKLDMLDENGVLTKAKGHHKVLARSFKPGMTRMYVVSNSKRESRGR